MSSFPRLKTGAGAQYPATKVVGYDTAVIRFLDGSEQRFRASKGVARRWIVRLELLDDAEAGLVREFAESVQGCYGSFSFEDPWDGNVYPDCSLERDELIREVGGEARASLVLVIVENRN